MSFQYNATGIQPTGGFAPIPKGRYLLRIESVVEKRSRNGDPMIVVNFIVHEGRYAARRIRFHNVTFLPAESKGAGMAIHFLKTIGEPYEGPLDIESERWINRLLIGHVDQEPDINNVLRNVVKDVEPHSGEEGEDGIPF